MAYNSVNGPVGISGGAFIKPPSPKQLENMSVIYIYL